MKLHKTLFCLILGLVSRGLNAKHPLAHIKRDPIYTNLYYNSNVFPHGLFDHERQSLVPKERFANCLFAWDLNGVVFKTTYPSTRDIYDWSLKNGRGVIKTVCLIARLWAHLVYLLLVNDPRLYVWDGLYSVLEKDPKEKGTVDMLRHLSKYGNKLNPNVLALMQELKQNNFQNCIISNMGQKLVDVQIERLTAKEQDPATEKIKKKHIRRAIEFLKQPNNIISSEDNGWLHKPDRGMYETCMSRNPLKKPNGLKIFIDDEVRFVTAALEDGLFDIAIQFTGAENVRILLCALSDNNRKLCKFSKE